MKNYITNLNQLKEINNLLKNKSNKFSSNLILRSIKNSICKKLINKKNWKIIIQRETIITEG